MSRYLDPKADVVFKKIFGEHPDLLKSFLNAVLPLSDDQKIASLEYLSGEQVPVIPLFKATIVDVKCTDQYGRVFIVEMQIQWTASFMQRMFFNASKAYIKQLQTGEDYHLLKPVYGLGLIASEFDPDPDHWYHHYKMVNVEKPAIEIKDLQLVFIELPKFKSKTYREKKLQVLWLRFISELDTKTRDIPEEWLRVPEIKKAVSLAEEAGYTSSELEAYDKYWDAVSTEKTLISGFYESGLQKGLETGREEGRQEGELKTKQAIVRKLLAKSVPLSEISALTELTVDEIKAMV
ncbi:MAG TPA: Rpn family recombination-promoting nuclease/putative transposase [Gammaproteobacteria bacterium]|nr:Rpn family recombination-promoting nuclease/putative transposase [Gammaproteobacteria bacterium]